MVMHKRLVSLLAFGAMPIASASAADIATKAPPPAPAPYVAYNWTGFYVGLEAGGGWATSQVTLVTNSGTAFPAGTVENSIDYSGALGGFYGGYNYQFNQFVIGIDGDYTWAALNGTGTDISPVNGDISHHDDEVNWVATATGRVGYAADKWLFFGKGGWAWAGFSGHTDTSSAAGAFVSNATNTGDTRNGWTAGGGLEYAVTPNVIFKLEGDYVKFDTANFTVTKTAAVVANSGVFARSATSNLTMFKGGLEYKF
jgi:outer membrane immunogenic protein